MEDDAFDYRGRRALLATMHAKEKVVAPALREALGLIVEVPENFDTDRFGTFSREIERTGTQLDAAKAKIEAVFAYDPDSTIALASEGSFGPDPHFRMLPFGREIVLLKDRERGLELIGMDASMETNFDHKIICERDMATAFAKQIGFPGHGLIILGCKDGKPEPSLALVKNIQSWEQLTTAVDRVMALCGTAFLETDMRAHRNPTRMRAIERATLDIVRRFYSRCPDCKYPGYDIVERISGLPCEWCHLPTRIILLEKLLCKHCGREEQRNATEREFTDPAECANCNP